MVLHSFGPLSDPSGFRERSGERSEWCSALASNNYVRTAFVNTIYVINASAVHDGYTFRNSNSFSCGISGLQKPRVWETPILPPKFTFC
eukprot:5528155-Amphidinium_carterae.1